MHPFVVVVLIFFVFAGILRSTIASLGASSSSFRTSPKKETSFARDLVELEGC